jgi:hypothetical protein
MKYLYKYPQNRYLYSDLVEASRQRLGMRIARYRRILSKPQLFIEGDHRTGAPAMSYILAREGRPPLVLTAENDIAFLDPSTLITETRKDSLVALFRIPKITRYFAKFLQEQADQTYLIATSARRVAGSA